VCERERERERDREREREREKMSAKFCKKGNSLSSVPKLCKKNNFCKKTLYRYAALSLSPSPLALSLFPLFLSVSLRLPLTWRLV
jgi:hypothetical protein